MRLAFFGDVVGKSGRDGLSDHLPALKRDLKLDFVVVNAENAAGGFGITENTARELFMAGADCLTLVLHWLLMDNWPDLLQYYLMQSLSFSPTKA